MQVPILWSTQWRNPGRHDIIVDRDITEKLIEHNNV